MKCKQMTLKVSQWLLGQLIFIMCEVRRVLSLMMLHDVLGVPIAP